MPPEDEHVSEKKKPNAKEISADDLRKAKGGVPEGVFEAPRFALGPCKYEVDGYHSHLKELRPGGYINSGYIITIHGGAVYACRHGKRKPTFDIEKHANGVARAITSYLPETFKGVQPDQFRKPSMKKSTLLYHLDEQR